MEALTRYIELNKDRFLEELLELLRIPSISADSKYKGDCIKSAEFLKDKLLAAGADKAELFETKGNPILYGEKMVDSSAPTVLIYGHYDVQPPDPMDLWDSGPFDPIIKETDIHPAGAIFARGSCDDKGQLYMHLKAFEAMNELDLLSCNMKFMFEGEEEVGSVHLGPFCKEHADMLACDMVLLSDTSIINNSTPSITVGLRGLAYMEVEVTGPNRDLHSGVYGGAVANPIHALSDMISNLHDENRKITIEGFYDDVVEVTTDERLAMNLAPFDLEHYKKDLGIKKIQGEKGFTTLERTAIRPCLDVNGIWGGYTGEGAKTVLPSKAYAKISMRLVPNQNPDKIAKLFEDHFNKVAPDYIKVKVTPHHGGQPAVTPTDTPEYKAAHLAMKQSFGKDPIPERSGGSIPIIALFEQILGVKSVMMGFGLDSDGIHSPNEHFGLFNYYKGIETIPYFYQHYINLKNA
jgi:acetylornithine deacetylase/succinyl-diaminopimelate desuccinylase-like protein